ncbi:MAG: CsgG/HfaB family protein [Elusimicrobiales bacterium]|nr:CsgG/HfaB family protein [Elusimicrobiales bacterium]
MELLKNIVLASVISCFCGNLYAGQASSRLSALAGSLIKDYQAKTGASKTTLAAFPFSCEEKLSKQRVGFAAAELISHRFVAEPGFTVVERGEINRLLSEQKLQASGATDSATAVKLGRVLGAGALLLGNINKVDGVYQVNARIVNAETSEVVVSGYAELPVDAFEDDAGVYLNLVPPEQTLGIYGVLNYRHNANDLPSFAENQWGSAANDPQPFKSVMAGGGLLYRPHKSMQINAELVTNVGSDEYLTIVYTYSSPPGTYVEKKTLKITTASLMTSYVGQFSAKWHYLAGLGLQYMVSGVSEAREDVPPGLFVKTGIEYKPQSRIGLGLNVKYEFKPVEFRSEYTDNRMMKMNPLSFETVLAMYF